MKSDLLMEDFKMPEPDFPILLMKNQVHRNGKYILELLTSKQRFYEEFLKLK